MGCKPTADQVEKIIKEKPEMVFEAIKAKPLEFFDVIREAEQKARIAANERRAKELEVERGKYFKDPLKPVVEKNRTIFGNKDAAITIVEYSDFQCGYCSKAHGTLKQLKEKYGDKVRVVYKHLPYQRPYGRPAAEYFEAIAMQDSRKAEKFHDYIFENQGQLRSGGEDFLKKAAKQVGANIRRISKDRKSDQVQKRIEADMAEARKFTFSGTPGFLVNGVPLRGAQPMEEFVKVIDEWLSQLSESGS